MADNKLENEMPDNYEVGYRKPPKHRRFQKGVSGSPKGRPKVLPDIKAAMLRELKTLITINENGRQLQIPKLDVIAKQAVNHAMKGKMPHVRLVLDTVDQADEKAVLLAQQARDAVIEKSKKYKQMSTAQLEALLAQQLECSGLAQEEGNTLTTE